MGYDRNSFHCCIKKFEGKNSGNIVFHVAVV